MTLKLLVLRDIEAGSLSRSYQKVLDRLASGDFASADVKKLSGAPLYRAKLDDRNRLLFKFGTYRGERHLLVLEIIRNHDYARSRFLGNGTFSEDDFVAFNAASAEVAEEPITYVNPRAPTFHILDKVLSFDDSQNEVFDLPLPMIVIGPAGSGKTALTLEKLKTLPGHGLYLSRSAFLVENASSLYQAGNYSNDAQEVSFLSMKELLETIEIPAGREATFRDFARWYGPMRAAFKLREPHKIYEEIKGVITGAAAGGAWMSQSDYLSLGVRQSIFLGEERHEVYRIFKRWRQHMKDSGLTDCNILAWERLEKAQPIYDFIVVDEIQDITSVELSLALKTLRQKRQFMLCGDSNQIVHPNLFSWAKVKSLFYGDKDSGDAVDRFRILHANYRNTPAVTNLANRLLVLKQRRFGSIDKESNYLVESVSGATGRVDLVADSAGQRREIDDKTRRSTRYAVIVLREEDKVAAQAAFSTPLVFSVQEAKGLEYENVILYNLVSAASREFRECTLGVSRADLDGDLVYGRAKDKTDKSLDAYKFYVNSLYVALTRAVRNVLIVEQEVNHLLWSTLGVQVGENHVDLAKDESSREEWQREARKLELQGKTEQADQIRRQILEHAPVPWEVVSPENFAAIRARATGPEPRDKAAQQLMFEYSLAYDAPGLLPELEQAKFRHARNPDSGRAFIEKTHYSDFRLKKPFVLPGHIARHGVDFRNPLGETALNVAAKVGRPDLVRDLLANGADPELVDLAGRNPWRATLHRWFFEQDIKPAIVEELFNQLNTTPVKVKFGNRMIKLESRSMEWFIFHVFLVAFRNVASRALASGYFPALRAATIEEYVRDLPRQVLPDRRRQRPYISSIFAKNEVFGTNPYNRFLFCRVERGFYVLNPALEISLKDEWVSVEKMLNLDLLVAGLGPRASMQQLEGWSIKMREQIMRVRDVSPSAAAGQPMPAGLSTGPVLPF